MTLKRRSIKLSPTDWQQLQDIAAATDSLATKGVKTGQPSWRALIRRIAQKELEVYEIREFTKDMIGGNLDVDAPINFFENLGMPSTAGMIGTRNPCPWCGKDFGWLMASCGSGTTWSLYKCPECGKFIARGWAIPDAVREDPDTKIIETEPIGTRALAV